MNETAANARGAGTRRAAIARHAARRPTKLTPNPDCQMMVLQWDQRVDGSAGPVWAVLYPPAAIAGCADSATSFEATHPTRARQPRRWKGGHRPRPATASKATASKATVSRCVKTQQNHTTGALDHARTQDQSAAAPLSIPAVALSPDVTITWSLWPRRLCPLNEGVESQTARQRERVARRRQSLAASCTRREEGT